MDTYFDRIQAGQVLGQMLKNRISSQNALILALPRGGVPVGSVISKMLNIPLDILIVRKLGFPTHKELAFGAIAKGGYYINKEMVRTYSIPQTVIDRVYEEEKEEMERRSVLYRGAKAFPSLVDKNIILVDDGMATGASMHAAVMALQSAKPAKIIVAVPVAPPETCEEMRYLVDEVVCPLQPYNFSAVGLWYQNFTQTTDEEVIQLLSGDTNGN